MGRGAGVTSKEDATGRGQPQTPHSSTVLAYTQRATKWALSDTVVRRPLHSSPSSMFSLPPRLGYYGGADAQEPLAYSVLYSLISLTAPQLSMHSEYLLLRVV